MVCFKQDLFLLRLGQRRVALSQWTFHCDAYGFECDRDLNAARVLELAVSSARQRSIGPTACGEERSGAARKSRVKRSPVKQEPKLEIEAYA